MIAGPNNSALKAGKPPRKRGPKTAEGKAKAMANLCPPWKPGEAPKSAGRPKSAGLSIREWMNEMQDWPRERILQLMEDKDSPVAQVAAARCWFDATSLGYTSSGAPVAGSDLDRICDRTDGKPNQPVTVNDLNKLTTDELAALRNIRSQLASRISAN